MFLMSLLSGGDCEPQSRVAGILLLTTNRERLPSICLVSHIWPWIGYFILELQYLVCWYWLFPLLLKALPAAGGRGGRPAQQTVSVVAPWDSFSASASGLWITSWNKSIEGISNCGGSGMCLKHQEYHGE